LSSAHNGENEIEANRVRNEHPGEPECILYDRVLGSIAVTRGGYLSKVPSTLHLRIYHSALGDFSFKLPAPYVERVFLKHTTSEFAMPEKIRAFIHRISTPPYVSGVPDVRHVNLASLGSTSSFLVMNSDGLTDLSDDRLKLEMLAQQWVSAVGKGYPGENQNLALKLLREGLGGKDEDKVSRMMTVEMSWKWMDDTTILVVRL
jgi:pyruvate dehydrogenase phosphatase